MMSSIACVERIARVCLKKEKRKKVDLELGLFLPNYYFYFVFLFAVCKQNLSGWFV